MTKVWSRRAMLWGSLGVLAGCTVGDFGNPLQIHVLKNSLPPLWLRRFRRRHRLELQSHAQLPDLYQQLKQPKPPNVLTLGLGWLNSARDEQRLTPVDPSMVSRWPELPPLWQSVMSFPGQPDWLPYRWGTTVLAYRRDKLTWQPQDWSDVWRPELHQRVSAIAQFRELLAIACKRLGLSVNHPPPWPLAELKAQLQSFHQQVRLYSDKHYIQPLILGDVLLAVGWSSDLMPVAQRYPYIQVVTPASGGTIWADGWVIPAGQAVTPGVKDWLNFGWEPEQVASLHAQGIARSPFDALAPHEFLLPMDKTTQAEYESLHQWWQTLPPVQP